MKKLNLVATITVAIACTANVFAQVPRPLAFAGLSGPGSRSDIGAPFPDPHPRHGVPPGPGIGQVGPLGPGNQILRPVITIQGKVTRLLSNPDFIFDSFNLFTGTDSLLVKFPAHMGSQVMSITKKGAQISVSGVLENPPFGVREIRMVSLNAGGKTLEETFPGILPAPLQENPVTGSGKINSLQTDLEGRVSGIFLDNKTLLRLPPHVAFQLGNQISNGSTIAYSGNQKNRSEGEIQLENYRIIHCNTITLSGQQYLVR